MIPVHCVILFLLCCCLPSCTYCEPEVLLRRQELGYEIGRPELDGICTSLDGPWCNPAEKMQFLFNKRNEIQNGQVPTSSSQQQQQQQPLTKQIPIMNAQHQQIIQQHQQRIQQMQQQQQQRLQQRDDDDDDEEAEGGDINNLFDSVDPKLLEKWVESAKEKAKDKLKKTKEREKILGAFEKDIKKKSEEELSLMESQLKMQLEAISDAKVMKKTGAKALLRTVMVIQDDGTMQEVDDPEEVDALMEKYQEADNGFFDRLQQWEDDSNPASASKKEKFKLLSKLLNSESVVLDDEEDDDIVEEG